MTDPNAAPTTAETTSYAAVLDRAIHAVRTRCLDYSLSDIEAICPSCAADIAALRELERLVEEAERVAKLSDQYGPSMVAWRDLIRSISTGFDPAEAERK